MNEDKFINNLYRCRKTVLEMLYDRGYDVSKCMKFSKEEFAFIMKSEIPTNKKFLTVIDIYTTTRMFKHTIGKYDIDSKSIEESATEEDDEDSVSDEGDGDDDEGILTGFVKAEDTTKPSEEELYEKISAEEEGGDDLLEISDDEDSDYEQTGGGDKEKKVEGREVIVKFIQRNMKVKDVYEVMLQLLADKDYELILVFCDDSYTIRNENGRIDLKDGIYKLETDRIQTFYYEHLIINITDHKYVPKHELIENKMEINDILRLYSLENVRELPAILKKDPVCRYYNGKVGDVFRIFRSNKNDNIRVVYRSVI